MPVARRRAAALPEASVSLTSIDLARLCARIADDKKAEDIVVMDLTGLAYVTDYFIIATAGNPRQARAISGAIQQEMHTRGQRPIGIEGQGDSHWLLMDYGAFVVHLFEEAARKLYDLDLLWGDVPRVEWAKAPKPRRTSRKEE